MGHFGPGALKGGSMNVRASLGIVILAVADVSRAQSFYRTVFGWPLKVDTAVYVEFQLPSGIRLGLYQREAFARNVEQLPQISSGAIMPVELYLFVEDLEAAVERLTTAGARLLSPPKDREWGDRVAYFADLDGNVLALAQRN